MPAHLKFDNRVSFTFQLEAEMLNSLKREAKKRKMSLSDLLNERLKSPISHIISLVK